MTAGVMEAARRSIGQATGRLRSLPILALNVHSACNCRCVMCDIWMANHEKREIAPADLDRHLEAIRRLHVRRVMLTGGEPLLHRNLWTLCDALRAEGIALTLVTTGLLIDRHAAEVARLIDHLVVSIDGPPAIHDAIRRVPGGFDRIARGLQRLRDQPRRPRITARSVVQRRNFASLPDTLLAAKMAGADEASFLAADLTSPAFNRPVPWSPARQQEIALADSDVPHLARVIATLEQRCAAEIAAGFLSGGLASLRHIHDYYAAVSGQRAFPPVRCNAPWVSAVLEANGDVRPCFFHSAYERAGDLQATLNGPAARAFRRALDVTTDDTCRRCVCSLSVAPWQAV